MFSALLCGFSMGLPTHVDLRKIYDDYGLTVCNQRGPLCWDYTVVGLSEYELATQRHVSERLSPGFLSWSAAATDDESNAGSNFGRAYRGLEKFGLAPLKLGGDPDAQGRGETPDDKTKVAAATIGRFDIHWIRFWNNRDELSAEQLTAIESEIAAGHPVAVGMRWPNRTTFDRNDRYLLNVPPRGKVFDGHCVALIGYKLDANLAGGGAFLFRNSWGENWADHGYAWMPFALLKFCINDALSIRLWNPLIPAGKNAEFIDANKFKVAASSGPDPVIQEMYGFGPTWSGRRQLFFKADESGQSITLEVPVAAAGTYELRLVVTRAQDYGLFSVNMPEAAAASWPVIIDGPGPGVSMSNPIPCGRFKLGKGANKIVLTVIGKGPASQGAYLGLDEIELVPVH
jgi:hypothetical protein